MVPYTSAGVSDVNGSVIDMQGFDGCMFVASLGTITSGAVTPIKVQQGAASNMSDAAGLEGTGLTIADTGDDTAYVADVVRPRERYVRVVLDRGTQNAVIEGGTAVQYLAKNVPASSGGEAHLSPGEGTA